MACRFAKVSEDEIEEAFFYPSDLVNTKTAIPLRVGEERWIYTSTLRISVLYPPLFTSPSGDSCIISVLEITVGHWALSAQTLKTSRQFHIMIPHDDQTPHQDILSY